MIQLGITIKGEISYQEPPMQMEKTITVDEEHYFKYFASLEKQEIQTRLLNSLKLDILLCSIHSL